MMQFVLENMLITQVLITPPDILRIHQNKDIIDVTSKCVHSKVNFEEKLSKLLQGNDRTLSFANAIFSHSGCFRHMYHMNTNRIVGILFKIRDQQIS